MNRTLADWGGNILALAIVITINSLANILEFGGNTTGAVSAKNASLFTPAGFTFAIWSLIYFLLSAFVVFQSLPSQRSSVKLANISPWFKAGCAANVLWILAWHFEWIVVTLFLMLALLVTLVAIYRLMNIVDRDSPVAERWLVQLPFSVYLAWITVATLANVSAVQASLGWNDLGLEDVNWTLVKLAVAGAVAAVITLRRNDVAFGLVISWAAFGISAGQVGTPSVAGAALTICLVTVTLSTFEALRLVISR